MDRALAVFTEIGLTQNYTLSGAIHELPLPDNKGFGYCLRKS